MNHNMKISAGVTVFDSDGQIKEDRDFCQPKNAYEADIIAEVRDADGNVTEIQIPFRSYTYNYVTYHYWAGIIQEAVSSQAEYSPVALTGAAPLSFITGRGQMSIDADANNSGSGIMVGTGSVSMSINGVANNLGGQVAHGTGSNQLLYGATVFVSQSVSGSGYRVSVLRPFSNFGSESVFVTEMGIAGNLKHSTGTIWSLIIRDTADNTGSALNIEVPSSGTLTVRYNFEVNPECGLNKNWNTWYYYDMKGEAVTFTNIRNIESGSGTISHNDNMFSCDTSQTGSFKGIVPGSGSGAVSIDDFRIGLIQKGIGAGQLYYQPHATTVMNGKSTTTGSANFAVRRSFLNASGAPIDINEVAIYASEDDIYPLTTTDTWMYTRFLTNGITLNDGETAEFRFVFLFPFS